MILYDVHTVGAPVRHFQRYEDPVLAQRMADHYAEVLHVPLVVEPIEEPVPATVFRIVASRRRRRQVETVDAGRADPEDLDEAMQTYQTLLPGWELHAIAELFTGSATPTTSLRPTVGRGGNGA